MAVLRLIPLGGLGEVGNNMMLLQYGQDAIMIDCGLMFPPHDMLGVDLIVPDLSYLKRNPHLLKAIFITHGHEDHIGALPYTLPHFNVPIYATKLTCGFIENKVKQGRGIRLDEVEFNIITQDDKITLGPFIVEPFHVNHSIPDSVGMAVRTPVGTVIHTAEFKFDPEPYNSIAIDEARLQAYGEEGVLALLSDSTNAERSGTTPSESTITPSLDEVFESAEGRIIVSTFASNINRIQMVADLAMAHQRQIVFVGRSMVENMRIARNLEYLIIPEEALVPVEQLKHLPDKKVAIICTGTQGEPNSALVRMANQDHHQVQIVPSDTVVISATTIPGNEEFVNRSLDNLFRQGANVIYHQIKHVHVSGHASRDGQKRMIDLTQPKYFVPIQGEYRMLHLHAKLGEECGLDPENILVIENGETIIFNETGVQTGETVPIGQVLIDGLGVGDVNQVVLRDRDNLSRDGFVTCVVTVDEHSGELLEKPSLVSRGFVHVRENEEMLDDAAEHVVDVLEEHTLKHQNMQRDTLNSLVQEALGRFFYSRTHRRPIILPLVLEV